MVTLDSVTENFAYMSTYVYYITTSTNSVQMVNAWYPSDTTDIKMAYSLHTYDANRTQLFDHPCDSSNSLNVNVLADIEEYGKRGTVNLFPNPAQDFVEVVMTEFMGDAELQIVNMRGKLVYSKHIQGNPASRYALRIQTEQFEPGSYIVTLHRPGQAIENELLIVY